MRLIENKLVAISRKNKGERSNKEEVDWEVQTIRYTIRCKNILYNMGNIVVRSLSFIWTTACQASLSFTISEGLLKLMSIESMMLSNYLILCHPFSSCPKSFPASESFPMSWLFASGGQSTGAAASASVIPTNIQSWCPLGLTGLISLQSKRLSKESSPTPQFESIFFSAQPSSWSNSHICTWLLEKL